jgi:hypothetical protein
MTQVTWPLWKLTLNDAEGTAYEGTFSFTFPYHVFRFVHLPRLPNANIKNLTLLTLYSLLWSPSGCIWLCLSGRMKTPNEKFDKNISTKIMSTLAGLYSCSVGTTPAKTWSSDSDSFDLCVKELDSIRSRSGLNESPIWSKELVTK